MNYNISTSSSFLNNGISFLKVENMFPLALGFVMLALLGVAVYGLYLALKTFNHRSLKSLLSLTIFILLVTFLPLLYLLIYENLNNINFIFKRCIVIVTNVIIKYKRYSFLILGGALAVGLICCKLLGWLFPILFSLIVILATIWFFW